MYASRLLYTRDRLERGSRFEWRLRLLFLRISKNVDLSVCKKSDLKRFGPPKGSASFETDLFRHTYKSVTPAVRYIVSSFFVSHGKHLVSSHGKSSVESKAEIAKRRTISVEDETRVPAKTRVESHAVYVRAVIACDDDVVIIISSGMKSLLVVRTRSYARRLQIDGCG